MGWHVSLVHRPITIGRLLTPKAARDVLPCWLRGFRLAVPPVAILYDTSRASCDSVPSKGGLLIRPSFRIVVGRGNMLTIHGSCSAHGYAPCPPQGTQPRTNLREVV